MTRIFLIAMLSLLALPIVGLAQNLEIALGACAGIESDLKRLDCYDTIAKKIPAGAPPAGKADASASAPNAPPSSDNGLWEVDTSTNPIDDSKTVTVSMYADQKAAGLLLRCLRGKPGAFIAWFKYLGSDAPSVLTRMGDGKPVTRRWSLSTDNTATFVPGDEAAFIKELMTVDRFVAQVTPYSSSPITAVFDVRGLANAARSLMETCKLK